MRLYLKPTDGEVLEPHPIERLGEVITRGWVWLDVTVSETDAILRLADRFGWDPITVADVLEHSEVPKFEEIGPNLFVVLHTIATDTARFRTVELDAFLGRDYLVTLHREAIPAIEWVAGQVTNSPIRVEGGPDRLLARIVEAAVHRYLPLVDGMELAIGELEHRAVVGDPTVAAEVQALRRDILLLRRVAAPQRDVLLELSDRTELVDERSRRRFADAYHNQFRIVESLDLARGILGAVVDTYRSTVAESMNNVMKVLTVFSAILLPLSLLASIYGMNFANMPELQWRYGYVGLLAVMAVTAVALWTWFARRGFIGPPKVSAVPRAVGRGLASLVDLTLLPLRTIGGVIVDIADPRTGSDGDKPAAPTR